MNVENKKRVTITIDPEMHEKGKDLAKQDHRDFSAELAFLIEKEAERRLSKETVDKAA